jgi:hypothetical protein
MGTSMSEQLTVFTCGAPRDHECDTDGPEMMGGDDVPTLPGKEVRERNLRGYTWGSVTCSKCGLDNMSLSMWRD